VTFLPRDASAAYAVMWCLSVTFVDSVETNKHIFKFFSPLGSQTVLVFFHTKRYGNIPIGTPPPTVASNAGGVDRNRDSEHISGSIACCEHSLGRTKAI